MKILNEYPGSHHYTEEWGLTELYCPNCGATSAVWAESGPGDYYLGERHLCTHCGRGFTIQGPYVTEQPNKQGILDQLRSGNTNQPTTKAGR